MGFFYDLLLLACQLFEQDSTSLFLFAFLFAERNALGLGFQICLSKLLNQQQ